MLKKTLLVVEAVLSGLLLLPNWSAAQSLEEIPANVQLAEKILNNRDFPEVLDRA